MKIVLYSYRLRASGLFVRCASLLGVFIPRSSFLSLCHRDSEAIIPNIFFFLVLLSYERYHSKQIISIPKIIQLCDGIMASGRKAVTHGT